MTSKEEYELDIEFMQHQLDSMWLLIQGDDSELAGKVLDVLET